MKNYEAFKVLEIEDLGQFKSVLIHPSLDDLELNPLEFFIFNQFKKGKKRKEVDELVLKKFGAVGTSARKKIERHLTHPKSRLSFKSKKRNILSYNFKVLQNTYVSILIHLIAFFLLGYIAINFPEEGFKLPSFYFGLGTVMLSGIFLIFIPWLLQGSSLASICQMKPRFSFSVSYYFINYQVNMKRLSRLTSKQKSEIWLVPQTVIALFAVISLIAGMVIPEIIVESLIFTWALVARWLLLYLPLKQSLFLESMSHRYGIHSIQLMWENLYKQLIPLHWRMGYEIGREQEKQLLISLVYYVVIFMFTVFGINYLSNQEQLIHSIETLNELSVFVLNMFIAVSISIFLYRFSKFIVKFVNQWFKQGIRLNEKSFLLYSLISLLALNFLLVTMSIYIQKYIFFLVVCGIAIVLHFLYDYSVDVITDKTERISFFIIAVSSFLVLYFEDLQYLMIVSFVLSFLFIRNLSQLLIACNSSHFQITAVLLTISGILGVCSFFIMILSYDIAMIPLVCTSCIFLFLGSRLRARNVSRIVLGNWESDVKLKKGFINESALLLTSDILKNEINYLFGKRYSSFLIKKIYKTSFEKISTESIHKELDNILDVQVAGTRIEKILNDSLSYWLNANVLNELLSQPANALPWKHRSFLRNVLEKKERPIELDISEKEILHCVKSSFLFSHFDQEQQGKIAKYLVPIEINKGEAIFKQGDEGHCLYLVMRGSCSIYGADEFGQEKHIIDVSKNDFFGEQSIMKHQPRSATVYSSSDVLLLSLSSKSFSKLTSENPSIMKKLMKGVDDLWFIRSNSLFIDYPTESLAPFINAFKHKKFNSGKYIFREGDAGEDFYIIRNGEIDILAKQKSIVLATLSVGDFFGEIALLRKVPRTASAKAKSDVETLAISRSAFNAILSKDENLLKNLEFATEQRMASLNE